jgi:hypothetical protein
MESDVGPALSGRHDLQARADQQRPLAHAPDSTGRIVGGALANTDAFVRPRSSTSWVWCRHCATSAIGLKRAPVTMDERSGKTRPPLSGILKAKAAASTRLVVAHPRPWWLPAMVARHRATEAVGCGCLG